MAPSVAASQAYGFADGNAGHVCTFTAGAPAVGDWDVLCVNSDTTVSTPSGFTLNPSRVNFQGAYIFRRKAAGGEGATVTVTTTGDHPTHVIWVRLSGADAADVVAVNGGDGSSFTTTPALSSGALAASGEIGIAFAALHSFTTIPASLVWGSSYTAVTSGNQGTGATAPFGAVAYKTPVGTAAEAPGLSWTNATNDAYMLFISFTAAAGGTAHTRTQIDTAGLADAVSTVLAFSRQADDSAGLTDSASPAVVYTRTVDDSAGLTDTATTTVAYARTVDDPLGLVDSTSAVQAGAGTRQVDDTVGLTDAVTVQATYTRTVTDLAGLTDTAAPAMAYARIVTDTLGLVDAASSAVAGAGTRQVDDSIGLTDAVTVQVTYTVTVADTVGLLDTVLATSPQTTVADVLGLTDTVVAALTAIRIITDAIGLTDTATSGALAIPGVLAVTGDRLSATVTGDRLPAAVAGDRIRMGVT